MEIEYINMRPNVFQIQEPICLAKNGYNFSLKNVWRKMATADKARRGTLYSY